MLDFFAGVPGRLKALADRLTAARAGYLDNLSAGAVAQASTALSNVQWTNARAGYLDTLNSGGFALENTPLLSPPIAGGVIGGGAFLCADVIGNYIIGLASVNVASSSYATAVTYTGQGVLKFAAVQASTGTVTTIRVTIDGNAQAAIATAATANAVAVSVGALVIWVGGANNLSNIVFDQIPFKTSLLIEAKSASGANAGVLYAYHKTA